MYRIVVDPGHGGPDPGAVGPAGIQEKVVTLAVAKILAKILAAAGTEVKLTRTDDSDVTLARRVEISNEFGADVFISIHANAAISPLGKGMEVWTSVGDTAADPLAESIANSLQATFSNLVFRADFSDGDQDKEANYFVLRWTKSPAVLPELGFITNPSEEKLLESPAHQMKAAKAIAEGVLKQLGLSLPKEWDPVVEIQKLLNDSLISTLHRPNDTLTWGEFATVLNRLREK